MFATPVPARSNERLARLTSAGPSLALALAATAAMLAAAHFVPAGSRAERIFDAVLPLSPVEPPAFGAVLSAIALVALAIGLRRGKRLSWELAVMVFGAAGFAQGVLLHHPVAASIAAGCVAVSPAVGATPSASAAPDGGSSPWRFSPGSPPLATWHWR